MPPTVWENACDLLKKTPANTWKLPVDFKFRSHWLCGRDTDGAASNRNLGALALSCSDLGRKLHCSLLLPLCMSHKYTVYFHVRWASLIIILLLVWSLKRETFSGKTLWTFPFLRKKPAPSGIRGLSISKTIFSPWSVFSLSCGKCNQAHSDQNFGATASTLQPSSLRWGDRIVHCNSSFDDL